MHTKIRVLVIDPDELVLAAIKIILTRARYDVAVAHNRVEGLAQLLHESFDVVVCNIGRPEKNSLTTLRGLKALAPTTPVVMIASSPITETAIDKSSFDYLSATIEIDGAKVIEKPFNGPDLVAMIYGCVAQRSARVH